MILHAAEQGSGPSVCLLHGLFGRLQNLAALARNLAVDHRVISLDLRNHGASPHAAGMGYAAMASDVLDTLADRDGLPCALLGHSMGGKVAMAAALAAPRQVPRLIVADIAPVAYRHRNLTVAHALQTLALQPGLDRRGADQALADAVPDAAIRGFLLQNLTFTSHPAWRIGLANIAAGIGDIEGWTLPIPGSRYAGPALFVAGDRSDYIDAAGKAAIAVLFPAYRLLRLPDSGHWLHADQPAAFAAAAAGFLADTQFVLI